MSASPAARPTAPAARHHGGDALWHCEPGGIGRAGAPLPTRRALPPPAAAAVPAGMVRLPMPLTHCHYRPTASAQQPQIILLKEGTDTSQGKPQLISNINACYAVADVVRSCRRCCCRFLLSCALPTCTEDELAWSEISGTHQRTLLSTNHERAVGHAARCVPTDHPSAPDQRSLLWQDRSFCPSVAALLTLGAHVAHPSVAAHRRLPV